MNISKEKAKFVITIAKYNDREASRYQDLEYRNL